MANAKTIAYWAVIVGAINWGLIGLLNLNLVTVVTGALGIGGGFLDKVVYILIGLSAAYLVFAKGKKR